MTLAVGCAVALSACGGDESGDATSTDAPATTTSNVTEVSELLTDQVLEVGGRAPQNHDIEMAEEVWRFFSGIGS